MRATGFALGLATVAIAIVPPLAAQSVPDPDRAAASYVEALRACDAVQDRAAKLSCLERASGSLVSAIDSGDVRLVDRKEREKQRRGLFGFSIGNLFGGGDDKADGGKAELAELESLVSTITEVRQVDRKTYVIRIAEANALWRIDEAPARFIGPKVGETVEFKKAAMNSYFIRVGKQIGVKGKRIG